MWSLHELGGLVRGRARMEALRTCWLARSAPDPVLPPWGPGSERRKDSSLNLGLGVLPGVIRFGQKECHILGAGSPARPPVTLSTVNPAPATRVWHRGRSLSRPPGGSATPLPEPLLRPGGPSREAPSCVAGSLGEGRCPPAGASWEPQGPAGRGGDRRAALGAKVPSPDRTEVGAWPPLGLRPSAHEHLPAFSLVPTHTFQ